MQLRSTCGRRRSPASHRQTPHGRLAEPRLRRLGVEPLESRRLLSVFLVENLDDSGDGSLRAAIEAANANPGSDTIEFAVAGTIYVESELPAVNDSPGTLLIDGTTAPGYAPGAEPVVVLDGSLATQDTTGLTVESASNEIRGLRIQSFNERGIRSSNRLTVTSSTIAGCEEGGISIYYPLGQSTVADCTIAGNSGGMGGGINFGGGSRVRLTVTNSTIAGNSAHYGGGIYSREGRLTVADSVIAGNVAGNTTTSIGGGIYNYRASFGVINCTITGNSANSEGGGVYVSSGSLNVTDSTVADNSANASGGGMHNRDGTLSVRNSIVAKNSANGEGGGILNNDLTRVVNSTIAGNSASLGGGIRSSGTLMVTNSTIADNSGGSEGGGIRSTGTLSVTNSTVAGNSAFNGGGICSDGISATLANSIVAQNAAATDRDLSGPLADGSDYNLIGIWSDGSTLPGQHNLSGTPEAPLDPALGHWTDLGEGLWGHLLLPESPALDAGSNALAVDPFGVPLETDLYGNPRIQDGVVDIGSVEGATEPSAPETYAVASLDDAIAQDGILTFREAFEAANSNQSVGDAPAGSFGLQDRIEFAPGVSGTLLLDGQALAAWGDLAIVGPGADELTFDAQDASRVLDIHPVARVAISGATITGGNSDCGGAIHSLGTLTVTDATITGNWGDHGGGISSYYATLTVTNSTVAGNSAFGGGGIDSRYAALTVTNSSIAGNSAVRGAGIDSRYGTVSVANSTIIGNSGGGIRGVGCTLSIADSTIAENQDGRSGGGICSEEGTLTVSNSTITGNSAYYDGGGIYSTGTLTVTDLSVTENSARSRGGGIYGGYGTLTVTDSTIAGNSTESRGGGIYAQEAALTIANASIAGNSAASYAGGICTDEGTLTLTNSTIAGNSASYGGGIRNHHGTFTVANSTIAANSGGGIYTSDGTWIVTNSTIAGNSAYYDGGGIRIDHGTVTLTNSIVAQNTASIYPDLTLPLADGSDYNLIGIWSDISVWPGEHDLYGTRERPLDPGLSHWTDVGRGVWGYLLLPDSRALNAGSNALAVDPDGVPLETDLYGNPRIQDGVVDMGAVEGASQPSAAVTYLVQSLDDSTAQDGIVTLGEAFGAANSNQSVGDAPAGSFAEQDRIEFAPGVSGNYSLGGRELTVYGDLMIGGPGLERLTFDAQGASRVFEIRPSVQVALSGATITGGNAQEGGGICSFGTLMLAECKITGNSASWRGGGMYNFGELTVTNSTIAANTADGGGGICNQHGTFTLASSTVSENRANEEGGGVYIRSGLTRLYNATIVRNSANTCGGGIYKRSGLLSLLNSTVARNSAGECAGGIYNNDSTVVASNSIIAHNAATADPDIFGPLYPWSEYDLIGIWTGGESPPADTLFGTVEEPLDPRLGPLGDYGGTTWTMPLLPDSPAVDAGDLEFDPFQFDPPLLTDQRGSQRIVDGDGDGTARIDMGAFEYVPGEALVLGRHVFYNASSFDGEDPAANQADDAAVAPDKTALRPGGTATFENYTSYTRGINGIMVDIAGLPPAGDAVNADDDFRFNVGNTHDPTSWATAPDPTSVSLRRGEGTGGSDRVTIIWPDNLIQKQWLQVTVLVTQNTGLEQPDVFYFGNAVGESGNSTTDAKVNAYDMLGARDNQRDFKNAAPIDFKYDYDRDARVNAYDMLIARDNQTHFLNALKLITVPGNKTAALDATQHLPASAAGPRSQTQVGMAWLHEFEQAGLPRRSSAQGPGAEQQAVDMLLAGW